MKKNRRMDRICKNCGESFTTNFNLKRHQNSDRCIKNQKEWEKEWDNKSVSSILYDTYIDVNPSHTLFRGSIPVKYKEQKYTLFNKTIRTVKQNSDGSIILDSSLGHKVNMFCLNIKSMSLSDPLLSDIIVEIEINRGKTSLTPMSLSVMDLVNILRLDKNKFDEMLSIYESTSEISLPLQFLLVRYQYLTLYESTIKIKVSGNVDVDVNVDVDGYVIANVCYLSQEELMHEKNLSHEIPISSYFKSSLSDIQLCTPVLDIVVTDSGSDLDPEIEVADKRLTFSKGNYVGSDLGYLKNNYHLLPLSINTKLHGMEPFIVWPHAGCIKQNALYKTKNIESVIFRYVRHLYYYPTKITLEGYAHSSQLSNKLKLFYQMKSLFKKNKLETISLIVEENKEDFYPLTVIGNNMYEAFWISDNQEHQKQNFPIPAPTKIPVDPQFLAKLKKIIPYCNSDSMPCFEHGMCCGKWKSALTGEILDSGMYSFKNDDVTWYFPQCILHYYEDHNVHPSKEFVEAIEMLSTSKK